MKAKALNDKKIQGAKPKARDYKLTDGEGLFLLVAKTGGKRWRFKYRFDAKEKTIALGTYPAISLTQARKIKDEMREKVANGISPVDEKKAEKEKKVEEVAVKSFTFELLAEELLNEWLSSEAISQSHYNRSKGAFDNYAYPLIGNIPVKDITVHDIKSVISVVVDKGANESARKLFYSLSKVFRIIVTRNNPQNPQKNYGIEINPCLSLDIGDFAGAKSQKSYPTITDDAGIKTLLLAIEDYTGDFTTKQALRLIPYTALRSQNIRFAEWSEIDFENKRWNITAGKMKTRQDFTIPLTDTMIEILEEVKTLTWDCKYIFPSFRDRTRPMSNNTLLGAIRRLGYTKDEFVPHGFRSMFSTVLREKTKFKDELIEFSLAHSIGSKVSRAYNRADYLEQRKELMQWWSDYLDGVKG